MTAYDSWLDKQVDDYYEDSDGSHDEDYDRDDYDDCDYDQDCEYWQSNCYGRG